MTVARSMAVVQITVTVQVDGKAFDTHLAAAFDPLRSVEAARGAGRQIGELLGECLALRFQHGGPVAPDPLPASGAKAAA